MSFNIVDGILKKYDEEKDVSVVVIPDGVIGIENDVFTMCDNITEVIIPESVERIGSDAVSFCDKLQKITIPESVKSIGDRAFKGCEKLADENGFVIVNDILFDYFGKKGLVDIPDGVVKIDKYAFEFDERLKKVKIPGSVSFIDNEAFVLAIADEFDISEHNPRYCVKDDIVFDKDEESIVCMIGDKRKYVIPDGVKCIRKWIFRHCVEMKKVILPTTVTEIESLAFSTSELTKLIIPESVNTIGDRAFFMCDNLRSVVILGSETEFGKNVFGECSKLTIFTSKESKAYKYAVNHNIKVKIIKKLRIKN